MRVIAGKCKGLRLKSLPGDNTRPTSDKVKEALFHRLGPFFDGEKGWIYTGGVEAFRLKRLVVASIICTLLMLIKGRSV
ncbi:RsmD family RNA methyltransferase [Geomicrobium sp. JCM 19039]|uniref:RsmD family RNA methyltransferase n=1 Tax=Geomicrobium sp. JCM 19039 TaxID=1460636 RepID=UPI0009DE5541